MQDKKMRAKERGGKGRPPNAHHRRYPDVGSLRVRRVVSCRVASLSRAPPPLLSSFQLLSKAYRTTVHTRTRSRRQTEGGRPPGWPSSSSPAWPGLPWPGLLGLLVGWVGKQETEREKEEEGKKDRNQSSIYSLIPAFRRSNSHHCLFFLLACMCCFLSPPSPSLLIITRIYVHFPTSGLVS